MSRILIIEDDIDLQEGLAFSLRTEGYEVMTAATAEAGLNIFHKQGCDLILLDCNLPDENGFDLGSAIKREQNVPVLMLTARDTEMDEVKALELGIDDFMGKPFSLAVLKVRIKKLLQKDIPRLQMVSGDIMIDKDSCKVYKNGMEINCSKTEYQMLTFFMEHEGIVLSKEQILSYVWDSQGNYVEENAVPVNVRRLRTKIEDDPQNPKHLVNVYGMGYIWKRV